MLLSNDSVHKIFTPPRGVRSTSSVLFRFGDKQRNTCNILTLRDLTSTLDPQIIDTIHVLYYAQIVRLKIHRDRMETKVEARIPP